MNWGVVVVVVVVFVVVVVVVASLTRRYFRQQERKLRLTAEVNGMDIDDNEEVIELMVYS